MRTTLLASSLALAFLAACGGGGGGGGVRQEPQAFSFSERQPNQTVTLSGVTAPVSGATLGAHTGGSATLTFDADSNLRTLGISTPQLSTNFDQSTFECSSAGVCSASNLTAQAGFVDPTIIGWDYQTFGAWAQQVSPLVGGAISVGSPTAAVPLSGSAVFTGLAGGLYSDSTGLHITAASMRANVNFGAQEIGFTTTDTSLLHTTTGNVSSNSGLNLSGDFSYAPGVNAFSGPVVTTNTELTGTGSGQFYGPTAQEIGGVYSLQGSGQTMIGGFGGTR